MDRQWKPATGRTSGRTRMLRIAWPLALSAVLLMPLAGCQIVIGVMQIFKGFPLEDADLKKQTGRSLDEKGKKVVILASSESGARAEHPSLDLDVIAELTRRFRVQQIDVIDSHKVNRWIDDNGGITNETDLAEIGPKFGADFIVLIKFDEFGFREDNSPSLYRGHARGTVVVVELKPAAVGDRKLAKQIYHRPFDSKYPVLQPISADQEKLSVFKQRYLTRLSEELARLFYDHRPGDDM
jgi:hypothetical protein